MGKTRTKRSSIEDNPGDARLLREMLTEQGTYNVELMTWGA